jgi:hypothetical protein
VGLHLKCFTSSFFTGQRKPRRQCRGRRVPSTSPFWQPTPNHTKFVPTLTTTLNRILGDECPAHYAISRPESIQTALFPNKISLCPPAIPTGTVHENVQCHVNFVFLSAVIMKTTFSFTELTSCIIVEPFLIYMCDPWQGCIL